MKSPSTLFGTGLLPGMTKPALVRGYGAAFSTPLLIPAGVTVLTALVVFDFLGERRGGEACVEGA